MRILSIIFCIGLLLSNGARAQMPPQGPYWSINIAGMPLNCTGSNGQLVPIYYSDQLAIPLGGARADAGPYGYKITLSPSVLNSAGPAGVVFIFFHECAHTALPMGVGLASPAQEINADCQAIRWMYQFGFAYSYTDILNAVSQMGAAAHGVNAQRINSWQFC